MQDLKFVKKELERIFKKGYTFKEDTCCCFEFVELLVDCDSKGAILAVHNNESMDNESLISIIDFDYMLNTQNNKVSIKANRFYKDDDLHAWLNFEEVNFRNNVIQIKCELYMSLDK